jgi:hypothetical protein
MRLTRLSDRGYHCGNINGQTCTRIVSSTSAIIAPCMEGGTVGPLTTATYPYTIKAEASTQGRSSATASPTPIVVYSVTAFAPMIQINWKASDTDAVSADSSQTMPTTDLVPSRTDSVIPSANAEKTVSPSMSSAAKSGSSDKIKIAVGICAAAAAIFLAIIVLLVYRRKVHQRNRNDEQRSELYGKSGRYEMGSGGQFNPRYEIGPGEPYELGHGVPHELEDTAMYKSSPKSAIL